MTPRSPKKKGCGRVLGSAGLGTPMYSCGDPGVRCDACQGPDPSEQAAQAIMARLGQAWPIVREFKSETRERGLAVILAELRKVRP